MPYAALRTILPHAGWADERTDTVRITGADPALPSPFRVGTASAAALAAVGLAASDLWELRTGRRQEVAIDLRAAAASLRSSHYLRLDGVPVATDTDEVSGIYPTRDGRRMYLHCNFPNHREAALGVLCVAADREAVRRAAAT